MKLLKGEIILYGTGWCFATRRARSYLEKNEIPYRYIDIDKDQEACVYVEKVNNGYRSVPTIIFPDGSILVEPSESELENKCHPFLIPKLDPD